MTEFELGPISVPVEETENALNEMRDEIDALKEWFQTSTRSLDLIKESSERVLTQKEAASVVMDIVKVALLAASMAQRNEMVIKTAAGTISENMSQDLLKSIEDMLKEE